MTFYRAAMEIDSCDAKRRSVSQDVSIAQIVTAITTVFYAAVFAIGYYMMIRGNREVLQECARNGSPVDARKSSSRGACSTFR